MNNKFTAEDLNQITQESLEKLRKYEVINFALRLRDFGIDLHERLQLNSTNSSKPPSTDNPFNKNKNQTDESDNPDTPNDPNKGNTNETENAETSASPTNEDDDINNGNNDQKRNPGRQCGSQGFWREQKPVADHIEHHHPQQCVVCCRQLEPQVSAHTAFYTYELERNERGISITCTLHYYYSGVCECGHENIENPGQGYISELVGRKRDLKLSEHTIVGPMLATFIASLNRRCGMSRKKIQEFLYTWLNFELSIGMICKSIREAGIACYPVVDELVKELQNQDIVHMDETPWYEKGIFCFAWVVISKGIAIYYIGTRKKEELLKLITETFFGWLITDGYGAYRSHPKRQRCLAHLIRKATALTGAVDQKAQKMGDWFLQELRGLIKEMAQGEDGSKKCRPILARLKRACNLGSKSDHAKLKSLANEILNDWHAVVAFVKNPELPPTNNEAERALRWIVLLRKITFGTRTTEGSRSLAALMSVIEICRLRNIDPWNYISIVIAKGRKGLTPPLIS